MMTIIKNTIKLLCISLLLLNRISAQTNVKIIGLYKNETLYLNPIKFSAKMHSPKEGMQIDIQYKSNVKMTTFDKISTGLMIIPATFIVINTHEIGHTLFAKVLGDSEANYVLYKKYPNGYCIGCNYYNYRNLSKFGNSIVPLGGVIFSQGLAFTSDYMLSNIKMNEPLQRFLALTYLLSKFDFVFQTIQGITQGNRYYSILQSGHPSGVDFVDFAYYAGNGNRTNFNLIRASILLINIFDIYLSRKKILKNWNILIGKQYYSK